MSERAVTDFTLQCPLPLDRYPRVLLAHGGGGRLMHELISSVFRGAFGSDLQGEVDAAAVRCESGRLAFTTDSFVVSPRRFPGGDIGALAVYGTVNDLATSGAVPRYLSAGFILEEGLEVSELWDVARSMAAAARRCGVQIITGDTKVVEHGKGDGLFINTTGIGFLRDDVSLGPEQVRAGDVVLVNGDLGRHGMAVMTARAGLSFESPIESDAAPLHHLVHRLLDGGVRLHCVRDLTRGGLASTLNEIATTAGVGIHVMERAVPVQDDVAAACELLGLDPFYVACEGRMAFFVAAADAEEALRILRAEEEAHHAARIGTVSADERHVVLIRTALGVDRLLDLLPGEQLPRIC